jgi:membrane protein YfhO
VRQALEILGLYSLVALGVLVVSRALRRRLPWLPFGAAFLLPILFVWRCLIFGLTPLPVDHALATPPWSSIATPSRYNEDFNDVVTLFAPWQRAVRQAWKEGSLPLRNRWNGCGTPLAAGLSEAFSPFTFLMFPLPLAAGFTLLTLTKLFLAFCGMWLWLAEMRVSATAATFGAISYAFSLEMTGWLLFPHTSTLCLWPWALLGAEVLRDPARRRRGVALLSAALIVGVLGHPEIAALGVLFLLLWVIARETRSSPEQRRQVIGSVALAGLIAAGLAAFLLVPEALAIAASNRARGAAELWRRLPFSLRPHGPLWKGYLTLFFPSSLGDAVSTRRITSLSPASFLETGLGYFGLAAWAAALSIFRPGGGRRRDEWVLLALMITGAGVALGCWPFFELFLHLPLMRLTPPLRYLSWVSLAGAALAAFEVDRLEADLEKSRARVIPILAVLLALGLACLAVFRSLAPSYRAMGDFEIQWKTARQTCELSVVTSLAVLALAAFRRPRLLGPLLAVVTYVELVHLGRHLYRFGSPADLFPQTPLIAFLRAQPAPFRVLGEGSCLFPNTNVFAGVEEIRTHDAIERRDYVDYLNRVAGYPASDYFKFIQDVNAAGLDRLNVRYLVSSPDRAPPSPKWKLAYSGRDGRVYENTAVWPRIFVPSARGESPDASRLAVRGYQEKTNSVAFVARVSGPNPVLAHTSFVSDGGWRARVQPGDALPVGQADGPFLSITIPPGEHWITLDYRPPGMLPGLVISVIVALALSGSLLRRPFEPEG